MSIHYPHPTAYDINVPRLQNFVEMKQWLAHVARLQQPLLDTRTVKPNKPYWISTKSVVCCCKIDKHRHKALLPWWDKIMALNIPPLGIWLNLRRAIKCKWVGRRIHIPSNRGVIKSIIHTPSQQRQSTVYNDKQRPGTMKNNTLLSQPLKQCPCVARCAEHWPVLSEIL